MLLTRNHTMNYNDLYSKVVSRSKASAIRELLKIIAQPDIISFAGDCPRRSYSRIKKLPPSCRM